MRGARSAPADRVLDIVELLSESGSAGLRFSDIARELGLSQATAHSILKTLSDRRWVTRDPVSKRFALGLALAHIAERFEATRPFASLAREAIARLSGSTRMPSSVVERSGDDLVITAFEKADGTAETVSPHERIPYAPPFGIACAAWDTREQQESWVQRGAAEDARLAERLRAVLSRTRDRGYDVDWMTPSLAQAARAIHTLSGEPVPDNLHSVIEQLRLEFLSANLLSDDDARGTRQVATISAPVLDANNKVLLILGVHPMRPMTTNEIAAVAKPLMQEVDHVARGGNPPRRSVGGRA